MHTLLVMAGGAVIFCVGVVIGGLLNEVGHHAVKKEESSDFSIEL